MADAALDYDKLNREMAAKHAPQIANIGNLISRLRTENATLVKALKAAPRPNKPGATTDPIEYIDWYFTVRLAALDLARAK